MDTTGFPPGHIETILGLLTWALIGFGALWLVTGVIGAMHGRAYNLTHAESGHSRNIRPDFLKVDKAKRDAAIARGERYEAQLTEREAAPKGPVSGVSRWSRVAATSAAVLGLLVTAITAFENIVPLQNGVEHLSKWDKVSTIVSHNQIGALLAVAIIGSNAVMVMRTLRKPVGK